MSAPSYRFTLRRLLYVVHLLLDVLQAASSFSNIRRASLRNSLKSRPITPVEFKARHVNIRPPDSSSFQSVQQDIQISQDQGRSEPLASMEQKL